MQQISFPVDVEYTPLASIAVTEQELVELLGHGVTPNEPFAYAGPVRLWAFITNDGQVVVVECHTTKSYALLFADPQDVDRAIRGLGIARERISWRATS